MVDQLQSLVATAEAMIASQGVPRTPENIQRAVQMLAANPDQPRTQVARQTGLSRAPEQMYLGDGVDVTPVEAAGVIAAPSTQQGTSSVPEAAPGVTQQQSIQPDTQSSVNTNADDIIEGDEFEPIDPVGMPLLPIVAPAAAAMVRGAGNDSMGMDIEGAQRALPGMGPRLTPITPNHPQLTGSDVNITFGHDPLLPSSPEQPALEPPMQQLTSDVKDYASKRTGRMYQVNVRTGEVIDKQTGKPLNSSAAQALLRTVRRM